MCIRHEYVINKQVIIITFISSKMSKLANLAYLLGMLSIPTIVGIRINWKSQAHLRIFKIKTSEFEHIWMGHR